MKLALRLAALVVLVALGVFAWRLADSARSSSVGRRPLEPSGARASGAPLPAALTEPPAMSAVREVIAPVSIAVRAAEPVEGDGARVHVRAVSKEHGEPVAGQRLFLRDVKAKNWNVRNVQGSSASPGEAPLTDAAGTALFEVEAGIDYRLEPDSEGTDGVYVQALAQRELREVELVVATATERTVYGRLIDAETERAIGEGRVCFDAERRAKREAPDVHSRSDGTFELHVRSREQHFASAVADGYARGVFALDEGHETPEHALEVRLSRAAALEVVVLDAARPAGDATVVLTTESFQLQQDRGGMSFYIAADPSWSATTDGNGLATIGALPPRVPLRLTVSAAGHEPRTEASPVVLQPGEQRRVEVSVGSGSTILGRVEDGARQLVSGCEIVRVAADVKTPQLIERGEVVAATTHTDAQGRFQFDDVPPGFWLVGPQHDFQAEAGVLVGLALCVHVEASSPSHEVVVRVDRDLYLRGIVLDPHGKPAALCVVTANASKAWCVLNDQTDDDGRFSIGPVPAGSYSIQAGGVDFPDSEELQAEAGASNLELHLPPSGTIHGRFVDASGQLRACQFLITLGGDSPFLESQTQNGVLELRGQVPGTYSIGAWAPDGFCALASGVVVRAGETTDGVVIVLQPGARLKLRYEGEQRNAGAHIRIGGELFRSEGVMRGTVKVMDVPAGDVEVQWVQSQAEAESSQHLTLAPGEERELTWAGKP